MADVNDIQDNDLLERAVRACRRGRGRAKVPLWSVVSDHFLLGSTYAAQLCRRYGRPVRTSPNIDHDISLSVSHQQEDRMSSFDSELRKLVEEWRSRGESDESLIEALRDEIESLNDLALVSQFLVRGRDWSQK